VAGRRSTGGHRRADTAPRIVIGLTILFAFGNVLALALRIGVPVYVAPLVAPAVDRVAMCGDPVGRMLPWLRRLGLVDHHDNRFPATVPSGTEGLRCLGQRMA
jgi:hypothetical protein